MTTVAERSGAGVDTDRRRGGAAGVALATHGLVRRYPGDTGVLGVDLIVRSNEVFGLVGPNGAGKTTLISLLCGLIRPDAGTVDVGTEIGSGRLALCPDTPEFEPWLSGVEVLRQSCALAHPGRLIEAARLREIMADTGISDYAGRRCGGYSRGMTQRLGIAAALVTEPEIVVLDEPTSALDAAGRADVLALIKQLSAQHTVILSSHALADVQRTADTIAVMDAGRLLFTGSPQTLINEHLRPAWRIILTNGGADAARVIDALRAEAWVRSVRARGATELDVETESVASGEQHLVPALARLGARVLSLGPMDADLESAFFALTGHAGTEARS